MEGLGGSVIRDQRTWGMCEQGMGCLGVCEQGMGCLGSMWSRGLEDLGDV